ncbi:ATP-binding cassette sub-family A member 3-like [Centruroides sculpturatus]|uniref:ATP-binding cassette sub-family A member 3-like n=1 Tax=Centruroides sculpturatus TaxID=218467 RepID=UPI000C6D31FD|nr:ATP-binding cassette sub-family A member 3-like [Centruroides sculpturatus]
MAGLRPLQILIWKNWIIHKRHYIWSIFELLLPLLCSFILVCIASIIPASVDFRSQDTDSSGVKHVNVTIYSPYNLQEYYKTIRKKDTFLFAPNNSATRELMENVFKEKELRVLGFESEEQLETFVTTDDDVIGAAIFLDFDESSTVLKYKLRISEYYGFKTEQTYYISSQKGPRIYKVFFLYISRLILH